LKINFFKNNNVLELQRMVEHLEKRNLMGLIHGRAGLGKTEAVCWYKNQRNLVYVRGKAVWSATWILGDIITALGGVPAGFTKKLYEQALRLMRKDRRTIFIDEADYLLRDRKFLEMIRDLHDESKIPIILIGMDHIMGRLLGHEQVWSRISQPLEFQPLSIPEISRLTGEWTGLQMEPEASRLLHQDTEGDFRLAIVSLYRLEQLAQANKKQTISAAMVKKLKRTR